MRSCCLSIMLVLTLSYGVQASAQDDAVVSQPPGVTDTAPTLPVERLKPVEKPKLEKPKPVERPRPEPQAPSSAANPTSPSPKPIETVAPVSTPAVAPATPAGPSTVLGSDSFSCIVLAFAMLLLGMVAGFLGRHLMSRHKLGGMTVRIGTWRGIP